MKIDIEDIKSYPSYYALRKDHDLMDKLNIIINLFNFLSGFTWATPNVIQMLEKVIYV